MTRYVFLRCPACDRSWLGLMWKAGDYEGWERSAARVYCACGAKPRVIREQQDWLRKQAA